MEAAAVFIFRIESPRQLIEIREGLWYSLSMHIAQKYAFGAIYILITVGKMRIIGMQQPG